MFFKAIAQVKSQQKTLEFIESNVFPLAEEYLLIDT